MYDYLINYSLLSSALNNNKLIYINPLISSSKISQK